MKRAGIYTGVVFLVFILGVTTTMASIFGKTTLGSPWKELFTDVAKLNVHFKQGNKAEIRDAVIENYDLSGARFENAKFENTEWRKVVARNALFKNTVFHKCKMESLELEQSTFENVTFEDCELTDVSFFESKLPGVRFINSKLKDETTFQKSSNGDLFFEHVTMNKVAFFQAQAKIVVKDSKLDRVKMNAMPAPSSLTFEKSELKDVNADRSVLSSLRATDSQVGATFKNTKIDRVEFTNNELQTSLSESTLGTLIVTASKIKTLRMNTARIDKVSILACTQTKNLGFYESTIREMDISRSTLDDLDLADVAIDLLTIRDTQLLNSDLKKLRAKRVVLENVSFDQKIDFTKAQVDQLTAKNITKLPGLNLITTGSNVKLD